MVDDDDDESPSPEPRTDSRSALPRGFRAWRRLHIVKHNDFFSLIFSLSESSYIELELESGGLQGAHEVGGRALGGPTLVDRVWAPWSSSFADFFINYLKIFRGVSGHSENFCFLHIKQHHGNSAENSVSPG